MLGLSSGLMYDGPSEIELVNYSSDFSSSVDGWLKSSVDQGDMAIHIIKIQIVTEDQTKMVG